MAGRPEFKPTDKQRAEVKALVAFGIIEPDIAIYIGCDPKTLRKYFRQELKVGAIEANAAVAKRLFQKATKDGDTTAMIWWTKCRMRWTEVRRQELTGVEGGPILVSGPVIMVPPESSED
jgi:hypothetical protein